MTEEHNKILLLEKEINNKNKLIESYEYEIKNKNITVNFLKNQIKEKDYKIENLMWEKQNLNNNLNNQNIINFNNMKEEIALGFVSYDRGKFMVFTYDKKGIEMII